MLCSIFTQRGVHYVAELQDIFRKILVIKSQNNGLQYFLYSINSSPEKGGHWYHGHFQVPTIGFSTPTMKIFTLSDNASLFLPSLDQHLVLQRSGCYSSQDLRVS